MKRIISILFAVYALAVFASGAGAQGMGYAPQWATQAEAQAGTATGKTMNPARTADALATYALYPAGVQIGYTQCTSGALITTAGTIMPVDDTIPQITEGDEILNCAYTGKLSNSKLEILFNGAASSTAAQTACALFIDSTANAQAVQMYVPNSTATGQGVTLAYTVTLSDTSAHTYRIRCGNNGGTAILFNGFSAARKYGGANYTTLTLREIKQ